MDTYAQAFDRPRRARAYRDKFSRGLGRRLSHRRERRCLVGALAAAGAAAAGFVVDVPCGAGRFLPLLAARSRLYLGLDRSLEMVRLCRERGGFAAAASAWDLPLPDRSVDLVACIRLSHHVPEPARRRALVGELCRVARGAVILSFLDRSSCKQVLHRLKGQLLGRSPRRPLWSREGVAQAAADRGFTVVGFYAISSLFSGQTLALLAPRPEQGP